LEIQGLSSAINIDECIAKEAGMGTSSGNITLKNSSGSFDLKASSGKILVAYKLFEDQHINIETSSGPITLELPGTAEFLLEAQTSTGKFQSDFPIKLAGYTDKRKIEGQMGTKDNKILLKTSSGSMRILKK